MPFWVLIYSEDADFCTVFAEQLQRQLQVESTQTAKESDIEQHIASQAPGSVLIVCDGLPLPSGLSCPVLPVGPKPLRLQELLAQTALFMHKASAPDLWTLTWTLPGGCLLSGRIKQLSHPADGRSVDVTDKELQLLVALAQAGGQGIAREALLRDVWGFDESVDTHTLETHIYRLRGKIKDIGGGEHLIEAIDGGYRMTDTVNER